MSVDERSTKRTESSFNKRVAVGSMLRVRVAVGSIVGVRVAVGSIVGDRVVVVNGNAELREAVE